VKRRVRVGVIGAGHMGRNHVRIYDLLRDAEIAGVADPDPRARDEVAAAYGVATFADHHALLKVVDAVSVAVPTALHRAVALDCLAAGKHVLIEKPIAATSEDAEAIVTEAGRRGLVLQVGHVERFNPAVAELGRIVASERLLVIGAQRLSPPTPRIADIDVVFDLMIHDIDIVLALAGAPIVSLGAIGRPAPPALLDHVSAQGRTENGILVRLEASKITHQPVRRLEVTTDRSYVTVNYMNRELTVYRRGSVLSSDPSGGETYVQEASVARPHVATVEPLRLELEHFLARIGDGREPLTSGQQALEALRVAERIQRAATA